MSRSSIPERFENSRDSSANRIRSLSILSLVLFLCYSGYLLYLQAIRGGEYRSKATKISQQSNVIPAQRGEIYDRTFSIPFVVNTDSFAIDITPADLPDAKREAVFSNLASALQMPVADIRKKISPANYHLYQPIEILGSVSYNTVTSLAERIDEFPGVSWHSKPVRNYIETGSLSHIIGYVGDITKDELTLMYNQGYKSGDVIGKTGIEKQYDTDIARPRRPRIPHGRRKGQEHRIGAGNRRPAGNGLEHRPDDRRYDSKARGEGPRTQNGFRHRDEARDG